MKIVNYRNTPFVRLVIPFTLGIILGNAAPTTTLQYDWAIVASLVALLLALVGFRYERSIRWLFGSLLQLTLGVVGYFLVQHHNELNDARHFSNNLVTQEVVLLRGVVSDAPVQGNKLKVLLRTELAYALGDSAGRPISGNLLLYVRTDSSKENTLHYGDRVWVKAKPQPVQASTNPHSFDYRNYLHHQNIHYTAYLESADIHVESADNGNTIWAKAFQYRDGLLALLQAHFTTQDEYAVASALLVGYKEDLSDEIRQAYADTGSMHALAVSGTHVGLLYMGLLFLFQRLPLYGRRGRIIETLLILLAIWGFTFITGATASVLRASVMFTVYLVGKLLQRESNIWNTLAASAFGLMAYNPHFLFDAGFQLSYAAVAGMSYFYPMLQKVSPIIKYRWLDEGWKILLVGITAQLGTLPLSLYYFHQFPTYFWLAGWFVVLGGAVFLWAGALLILLDWLLPWVAHWLGWGLSYMLWGMNKIIYGIQLLPGSVVSGIWLEVWGVVLLYFVIASFGLGASARIKGPLLASCCALCILFLANTMRGIDQFGQKSISVYSTYKGSLVDIISGRDRVTVVANVTPKQETFAAQGHRWASGVGHDTGQGIAIGHDTVVANIRVNNQIIQNGNLRLAIVDRPLNPHFNTIKIPVNAVLVRGNPVLHIEDLLRVFDTRKVVFDQSNTRRKIGQWKEQAEALGLQWADGACIVVTE